VQYEELVLLLTHLSELAFIKECLAVLGREDPRLTDLPPENEIKEFLARSKSVYPSAWSLPHTIVLDCKEHWWWKPPIG
jgi:hypothetical protein